MSLLKEAHIAGFDSVEQLAKMTGISRQTLDNWRKHRPETFRLLLKGCAQELRNANP